jgi:hypothetical protein
MQNSNQNKNFDNQCSVKLKHIKDIKAEKLSLFEIISNLEDAGFAILMIIFSAPMLIPTPGMPGISQSFGTVLAILAWQIICGRKTVWLPEFLGKKQISKKTLDFVIDKMMPYVIKLEGVLKPRITWLAGDAGRVLFGIVALICVVPIVAPFPFSNTLPAFAICFMALGLLERDGLFAIIGIFTMFLGFALIAFIAFFGLEAINGIWNKIF